MHGSESGCTAIHCLPLLAGLLIVLANAFFVTVEFAVVTSAASRRRLAEEGVRAAEPSSFFCRYRLGHRRVQLGITVASILLGVVAENRCSTYWRRTGRIFGASRLRDSPLPCPPYCAASLILLSHGSCEQTPKTIALRYPCVLRWSWDVR